MDRKTKIQLLLDMQENPEQYSEEELKTMLEDDEVRELMESAALLKQAMTWEDSEINPDVKDSQHHMFQGKSPDEAG